MRAVLLAAFVAIAAAAWGGGTLQPLVLAGSTPETPPFVVLGPSNNALVFCSCPKCGTTSTMDFFYRAAHGKDFGIRTTPPYVQEHWRWEPKLAQFPEFDNPSTQSELRARNTEYLALGREPLDRYVSAFRSKLSCGSLGVDVGDRPRMVKNLVELVSKVGVTVETKEADAGGQCLSFAQFAKALIAVHERGDTNALNGHIKPQSYDLAACAPAEHAQHSTVVNAVGFSQHVERILGSYGLYSNASYVKEHGSNQEGEVISEQEMLSLCNIAWPEYVFLNDLGGYVKRCGARSKYIR